MPYTLSYKDRYMRVDESKIESDTSNSVAFASLPDDTPTRLMTEWTGRQFTKMLSAMKTGAELMFPDEANEILWQLVKVVHQPVSFGEEDGCINFLPSAPFVVFAPQNPYNQPDFIPPDYVVPPFMVNSEFEYPSEFGYLATDVFVQPAAINIDPIDLVTLNLPTIKISVVGSGQIELDFLSVSLGSYAVLKVGSPPNILDIILDGILDDVTIIDLNNDSVSIPPESDILTAEEVNIEAEVGVMTDVYIVFVPTIDDSLIPLRFGGGLRQIGLCGFETVGSVGGVEDVRFNVVNCSFEKRVGGVWEVIEGGDEWLDCVPEGGGGGGGASLLVTTYGLDFANQDTTSTTMVKAVGTATSHNFTKSKAIVIAEFMVFNNSASNTYAEIRVASNQPTPANPSRRLFNSNTTVVNTGNFEDIALGSREVAIFFSAQSGTARIVGAARCVYTIIEYESIEDLFVEDVRIVGRDLQKKIGGVWITVSDSLSAIFDSIDSQISAINATNTSQQAQINTATSVNTTQNSRLTLIETNIDAIELVQTAHDARLDSAESRLDDIDLSIAGLIVEQATQNGRLDDLEAAAGGGSDLGSWGGYRLRAITDINTNGAKYSSSENTYDTGTFPFTFVGWIPNAFSVVKVNVENAGRYNSMAYLRVGIVTESLVSGAFFLARINGGEWSNIMQNSGGNWTGWLKVPQIDQYPSAGNHDLEIEIQSNNSDNEWRWKGAVWAYINVNPFDGTTSDD